MKTKRFAIFGIIGAALLLIYSLTWLLYNYDVIHHQSFLISISPYIAIFGYTLFLIFFIKLFKKL